MTTPTPQDYALKPCPFCAGAEIFIEPDERGSGGQWVGPVHVGCKACGCQLCADDESKAVAWWNRRAPQSGWINVDERLPEPGTPVLLDIGKKFPIRAMWAAKHTVGASDECPDDWADYDAESDEYYCPEGWYEWNEHEETHWSVSVSPIAWIHLPIPPPPSTKGAA